jgi:hypothetical protein
LGERLPQSYWTVRENLIKLSRNHLLCNTEKGLEERITPTYKVGKKSEDDDNMI